MRITDGCCLLVWRVTQNICAGWPLALVYMMCVLAKTWRREVTQQGTFGATRKSPDVARPTLGQRSPMANHWPTAGHRLGVRALRDWKCLPFIACNASQFVLEHLYFNCSETELSHVLTVPQMRAARIVPPPTACWRWRSTCAATGTTARPAATPAAPSDLQPPSPGNRRLSPPWLQLQHEERNGYV